MDVNSTDRYTIRSTIEQQLQAFQKDDAEAAFALASSEIREKFETAENFLNLVKTDYAAVYRPRSVMFEQVVYVQGLPAQEVILLAPDGNLLKAIYLMAKQADGSWKISGCLLSPVHRDGKPTD